MTSTKSLRDEVESLASEFENTLFHWPSIKLRDILSRHPAADGVVVPRDLLSDLRDLASDAVIHHHGAMAGHEPEVHAENDRIIEQADAILSTEAEV